MGNARSHIMLFSLLFIILGGGTGYTEAPPQNAPNANPATEPAPQPEAPKKVSTIIVDNDRLSVEFVDVNFGEIILSIGQKAGFGIEGFGKNFNKKVTTNFNDLDIETGVMRLFSLVNESNYRMDYDGKGKLSKVKIIGDKAGRSTDVSSGRSRPVDASGAPLPTAGFRPIQPPRSSRFNRLRQAPQAPQTPAMPQTPQVPEVPQPPPAPEAPQDIPPPEASPEEPQDPQTGPVDNNTEHEQAREQEITEIPYSPPQKTPIRIPAVTRRPGK